ncbi:hypothetical protein CTheo_7023 [Ceratobasidium theobromae]|uniref:Uncharacterized protein n=1 Tax=Ceratobasidium theobromae TaxID=1582974 RepID=A0A5N5QDK1_9AGAM|nr:hypothetical protein CTheo_7023 [Ceratobasidium theobromae]
MAEAGFTFPDITPAELTIDGEKVNIQPEGLSAFDGTIVETNLQNLLPQTFSGFVRYFKNAPPTGPATGRCSIVQDQLFILFTPDGAVIPNAYFQSQDPHGPIPPIGLVKGTWGLL